MRYLLPLFIILTAISFSCKSPEGVATDGKTMSGKVIKQDFLNKAGRKIDGVYDLFYKSGEKKYFIKTNECKVSQREILDVVNKPIKIKYKIKEGLWDADDPNVQSRIGEYIVILEIITD